MTRIVVIRRRVFNRKHSMYDGQRIPLLSDNILPNDTPYILIFWNEEPYITYTTPAGETRVRLCRILSTVMKPSVCRVPMAGCYVIMPLRIWAFGDLKDKIVDEAERVLRGWQE